MALRGQAGLCSWNNVAPTARPNFLAWHSREHMPERLSLPGFLRARRYQAVDAQRDYFICYEVDSHAALTSPTYLARLNAPTPWTRRSVLDMRDSIRAVCVVADTWGAADGERIATLRCPAGALEFPAVRQALRELVGNDPGLCAGHLLRADAPASSIATVERGTRPVTIPTGVVLVEGQSVPALRVAAARLEALLGEAGPPEFFALQDMQQAHRGDRA